MRVATIAIPRGPREPLSYKVPDDLRSDVAVGCRVLAPLGRGNRRVTGYVVEVGDVEKPAYRMKPLADALDDGPLFDSELLELFRFISGYYHATLGDVIRTGLPAGLNVRDSRLVSLTERGRQRAPLDPLLSALLDGDLPTGKLDVPTSRLLRLADEGLVTLRYELSRAAVSARFVQAVAPTGEEPSKSLRAGGGPAVLLDLLRAEGTQIVRSLSGRVPNHGPAVRRLVALGAARVERVQQLRDPWRGEEVERDRSPSLTVDQRAAVDAIVQAIDRDAYEGFLLRGVTGSGKTEVYLHALAHALERGRGAIVLVPEIALTPQLSGRFRARFGDQVAVLHSALSDGERLDQWQLIRSGRRPCVVGARSAVFAPIRNLGLLVVDEEHESSFKQDDTPRYHARDMALKRGHAAGCAVVLGSATPSLETVANAASGRLTRLDLPGRIGDRPMPSVELVDLRANPPVRREALLSAPLIDAIREAVGRGEQSIVFLNRRGFANCFVCRTCGEVPMCRDCTVSLTYHRGRRRMSCHYCDFSCAIPTTCVACRSPDLMMVGTGTEQVEAVLSEVIPEARVARMDRDTTRGRALNQLLDGFRAGEIDVLVGTQMVAKGHDFPQVTVVGVLLAEQMLRLQDFRASERTFQLLTQVAGRAGRHELEGRVLVQTFAPDHHSLQCALQHDVQRFVDRELRLREARGFPPFGHVCLLRLDSPQLPTARDAAGRIARRLREGIEHGRLPVELIGPNPATLERIKGRSRFQVLLLSKSRAALHHALSPLEPPPTDLLAGARLAVDVDPVNLL